MPELEIETEERWFMDQFYAVTDETLQDTITRMHERLLTLSEADREQLGWYLEAMINRSEGGADAD